MKGKRVNKSKEEILSDMDRNHLDGFKADLQELEKKYGYRLEPVMYYSRMGVFPQLEVVKVKDEVKEEKSLEV